MTGWERRGYLDWLRGIGVLVMVEAHALDAWTSAADRTRQSYGYAMVLAGFAAPIFLFLAGVSMVLSIGRRVAKGTSSVDAARLARRRGWQILGLGFLFRLQSWVLSGGAPWTSMLKVDILNVMGLALVMAAASWSAGRKPGPRGLMLGGGAIAIAMATPLVRATPLLSPLPDAVESYLRPMAAGTDTFSLFPWAGFVLAGAIVGLLLERSAAESDERRMNGWLALAGLAIAAAGYAASLLPPIYATTNFWTSSPTFFFLRTGILTALVPIAYVWQRLPWTVADSPGNLLRRLGQSSLFVYWIHVELVYGGVGAGLRKRFSLEEMVVVYLLFIACLCGLTWAKQGIMARWRQPGRPRAALTRTR